ncbi:ArnT family glycosyltransferase [Amycolatopsis nigrescens]|uniref:ArnT family glycosyltransferase n=1 Tax=Amycolatopsis nigrescens TaxID=381445 RepID=UPI00037000CE|nr:glycosyltransferase family 39 protein [Amycolatopsis nigrescens]
MTTTTPEAAPVRARPANRWRAWTLAVICLTAALLYVWKIGNGQLGNSYYSGAVKSMTQSFTNFLFGSFDPYGVVTVDKPPMSLWPQVVSVWIFGYHGWALLLPQAIEGVAAVFLLHRTVRRWAGEKVALLAALILALTPITVAVNRDNNTDSLLVLLLVAAAYAVTRSIQDSTGRGRTGWLLCCAFLVGCGFLTKMLQAWIVLPAFVLAYLVGSTAPVKRRLLDLCGAAVVLFAASFWWVALHDWWPGDKPAIGGSTDGSAWDLVFGYNGFGRVFGQEGPGAAGPPPGAQPPPGGTTGATVTDQSSGLTRMFAGEVGGQISWLLPLSLFVLLVVAVTGVRRITAKRPGLPAERAGWFLWGGWLVVTGLVFSYAQGIWHSYYTTMLAPAVAAVAAAGLVRLWRAYRDTDAPAWVLLPVAVAISAAWAFVLVSVEPSWFGWTRWAVLLVAAVAIAGLVGGRLWPDRRRGLGRPAFAAGCAALLLTPAVWSAAAANDAVSGMPLAGPMKNRPQVQNLPGGGMIMTGGSGGGDNRTLSGLQERILDYVQRHNGNAGIDLAVHGAQEAAPFLMHTDATVVGLGGFMGSDNTPSVDQLRRWVADGTLKFVMANAKKDPNAPATAPRLLGGTGPAQQERQQWIEQNCAVVDPAAYGGSADGDKGSGPMGSGPMGGGPMGGAKSLYQCG